MAFEFHLPDIGEGVVEGEIVAWRVKEGDTVKLDQPIVEVMTDKATVEIPSPRAGRIAKINYTDGQICPVGQVLVDFDAIDANRTAVAQNARDDFPVAELQSQAALPLSCKIDGRFIILDEDGHLILATATPEGLTVTSKVELLSNQSWTVPSLSGTRLYTRDRKNIVALELGVQ